MHLNTYICIYIYAPPYQFHPHLQPGLHPHRHHHNHIPTYNLGFTHADLALAPGLQIHKFVVGFSAVPTHPGVDFEVLFTPGVETGAAVAAPAVFVLLSVLLVLDLAMLLGNWAAMALSEVPNLIRTGGGQ